MTDGENGGTMTDRSDRDEIHEVLLRYCYLVDVAKEPHRLGVEVFTEDAVDNHGLAVGELPEFLQPVPRG